VTIDLSGPKKDRDCRLDEKEKTIAELLDLKKKGVGTMIDVTNRGMGRNPRYAQAVSEATGISILHATGFYKAPFYPEEVYAQDEQGLATFMARELEDQIEQTGIRASVIGEIGTGRDSISEMEKKVFRAACIAQHRTGAPIVTHTTLGTLGLEQTAIFREQQADLSKIVLSHIDLSGSIDYMKRLLDQGINIAFDTIGKISYQSDENRAKWLCELCNQGYADQIVLSMDITRKSHLQENGGLGYGYLLSSFVPLCKSYGLSDSDIRKLLEKNPERIYRQKA
jgi:phosphotriesterase-related protein